MRRLVATGVHSSARTPIAETPLLLGADVSLTETLFQLNDLGSLRDLVTGSKEHGEWNAARRLTYDGQTTLGDWSELSDKEYRGNVADLWPTI